MSRMAESCRMLGKPEDSGQFISGGVASDSSLSLVVSLHLWKQDSGLGIECCGLGSEQFGGSA